MNCRRPSTATSGTRSRGARSSRSPEVERRNRGAARRRREDARPRARAGPGRGAARARRRARRLEYAHNLTAIKDPAEVVDKHLLDSLAVLPHLKGLSGRGYRHGRGVPGPAARDRGPRPALYAGRIDGQEGRIRATCRCHAPPAQRGGRPGAGGGAASRRNPSTASSRGRSVRSRTSCGWPGTWPDGDGRLLAMKGRVPEDELKALPAGWKALAVHPIRVPGLDAERCLVELARV